jgi:hypothetical protein
MSKSESGRIVLKIEPSLKKQLYSFLALENKTLKDWFSEQAKTYVLDNKNQLIRSIEQEKNEI